MVKQISAEEFDRMFDDSEDVSDYVDWSSAERINTPKRVNVDIPIWMIRRLDTHATMRGVSRQALIKMWLADRLEGAG